MVATAGSVRRARLLAVLVGVLLSACTLPAPAEPEPGTLRMAVIGSITAPDPDVYYGARGQNVIGNVYEGLVRYQAGVDHPAIEPWLATAWTANDDFTAWTFTLRDDVTFHDGTPFDSAAILPAIQRRAALGGGAAYLVDGVVGVDTPDPSTATIRLAAPNSAFVEMLASPYGLKILSPTGRDAHAGDDDAQTYLLDHDLGSGPYELAGANPDVGYRLRAFDRWWGGTPAFGTVEVSIVQDATVAQVQFDAGDLDVLTEGLTRAAWDAYAASEASGGAAGVAVYDLPVTRVSMLRVNPGRPPFDDPAVRTALRQAIDPAALIEPIWGSTAVVRPGAGVAADELAVFRSAPVDHDPAPLAAAVAALPADERSVVLAYRDWVPTDGQLANRLAAALQDVGLAVEVRAIARGVERTWRDNVAGAPQLSLAQTYPDGLAAQLWASVYWTGEGSLNVFDCVDPQLDSALADAVHTGDDELYRQVGERATALGCWITLAELPDLIVARSWLSGVQDAHNVAAPSVLYLPDLRRR